MVMSAGVNRSGTSERQSNGGNSPRPSLLVALKGLLSLQLFHKGNGNLLFSWVRLGGGDGSRHAEVPRVVDGDSVQDQGDTRTVTPHGLSSCKAMALGSARGCWVYSYKYLWRFTHNRHTEFADGMRAPSPGSSSLIRVHNHLPSLSAPVPAQG